ncbi:MAG: glycoside hydrolase family 2 TIM barrel-domain containing protein [Gemmataceae bacterium]
MRLALALLLMVPLGALADEWKPARGPLMTRWAKDVTANRVHPEYPRPQLVRERWLNLNGVWEFGPARGEPHFGAALPRKILVPFPVESALSGVMESPPRVWYRRTFTVPEKWAGQRILLHFGAVNWESEVYVNGKKLTTHRGGYDPFSVDVTEALMPGGPQELFVTVHNPVDAGPQPRGKQVRKPGGIFYVASTGIWQTVWLEPVPASSIARVRVDSDLAASAARLKLDVRGEVEGLQARWEVRDGTTVVARGTGQPQAAQTIALKQPKLWSPDAPFLYSLKVTLEKDGKPFDQVESYFAMRSIALGKDRGGVQRLFLNGKELFQVGMLDQGFWPDGLYTAPTDEALRYDIEVTKKLGFNLARKHVKVEPARWYYWADRLGLLVWQDMPSGDQSVAPGKGEIKRTAASAKQFEQELSAMVDHLSFFPSIVLWVVFNEGWGQYDTVRLSAAVKKQDPTRLVTGASGWNDMKCSDIHDIHVYPGPGAPAIEPTRAGVLGEFGGLGLSTPGHMWTKEFWGYRGVRNQADLTRKYERLMQGVYNLKKKSGLAASIYTQTTDVETEANGLLTYDRAVIKVDVERVVAANRGNFGQVPSLVTLAPTAQEQTVSWRYSFDKPAARWFEPTFDDATWKQGPGGFGSKGTPGAVVRTEWTSKEIWLRREITLKAKPTGEVVLLMHHDEDAEIYLNGVLAARVNGYTTDYEEFAIAPEALKTLRAGRNTLAVRCVQTTGGQYIDVGLAQIQPALVSPK